LHKILLNILTFVDAGEVKFGSLKMWNWIIQLQNQAKITPCHQSPLSNLANHMLPRVSISMD